MQSYPDNVIEEQFSGTFAQRPLSNRNSVPVANRNAMPTPNESQPPRLLDDVRDIHHNAQWAIPQPAAFDEFKGGSKQMPDQLQLTPYQRRLWAEVDRILYQNYLSPRTVTDFWRGDNEGIVWHLKQMKDRVMRSIIIIRYVELDDLLNRTIIKCLLGKTRTNQRDRRFTALNAMLERLYPQQKLDIVKTFLRMPNSIYSHVMGLNTIRNSFAHRFHLSDVPKSKRLYKGKYDVFTKKGLEKFQSDMWEVDEFFDPESCKLSLRLVRSQRKQNESARPTRRSPGAQTTGTSERKR